MHGEALQLLGQAAAEREASEAALMAELAQLRDRASLQPQGGGSGDRSSGLARELAAVLKEKDRLALSCEVRERLLGENGAWVS